MKINKKAILNFAWTKHLFILAALLIYVFTANQIYVRLILKDGKPVSDNVQLPPTSPPTVYKLADVMQPVRINGENLYEIKGYAFNPSNPKEADKISVVLTSATQKVAFPTRSVEIPDMIESYKGFVKGMEHAEFSFLLSKNALKAGTYKIGILLEKPDGSFVSYTTTAASLQKTPNTVKYIPAP